MKINLDLRSGKAIYQQIADEIARLALQGELNEAEPLPSVRQLAAELGINPNTVQKAYRHLEQAGLLLSLPARGSFIRSTELWQAEAKKALAADLGELCRRAQALKLSKADLLELLSEEWRTDEC